MTKLPRWLAALAALLLPLSALTQQQGLTIDIVGGNSAATPIAIVPMPYHDSVGAPATDVSSVVAADLNRSVSSARCHWRKSLSARHMAARSDFRLGKH